VGVRQVDQYEDRLLPTEADYERLFSDRDHRFADVVEAEANDLLERARQSPGEEHRAVIASQLGVGGAIEVVDTLEETYVAIRYRGLTPDSLPILLAAFFPDRRADELEDTKRLPNRTLGNDEIGFVVLRG
jgi:hypothetical protein